MARAALRPLQAEQGLQFADAVHDRGRFGGTELLGARRSPGDPDAPDTGRPGRLHIDEDMMEELKRIRDAEDMS